VELRYFGWSGVTIWHQGLLIGFDLFGEEVSWQRLNAFSTAILCVTHGHPEHCGSLRQLLEAPEGVPHLAKTHLVSSAAVVRYLASSGSVPAERCHPVEASACFDVAQTQITAFQWNHMPLLPPGLLPKAEYLTRLAARPLDLLRIGLNGLRLPANAPTLGWHVKFPDGRTVLNYAEGLHRLTMPGEVQAVARQLPAETLIFAVEPEDVGLIPRWVEMLQPSTVFVYEAHRPWRELFGLPYLDLDAFAEKLAERFRDMTVIALTQPNQVVNLEP
jgi:hypothetical protein